MVVASIPIEVLVKFVYLLIFLDIDECATGVCDQGCENNEGSYRCFCFQGYRFISNSQCLGELSAGIQYSSLPAHLVFF